MADLRDLHGNPVQLADQYGKPVELTDEYGNPVHITGVATTHTGVGKMETVGGLMAREGHEQQEQLHRPADIAATGGGPVEELHSSAAAPGVGGGVVKPEVQPQPQEQLHRTDDTSQPVRHEPPQLQEQVRRSSSGSSSSEDDGQGGRRKKKGLKEKIKERFGGGKHKDKDEVAHGTASAATTHVSSATSTTVPGEKKGVFEKIKEKLPGHHHNHNH